MEGYLSVPSTTSLLSSKPKLISKKYNMKYFSSHFLLAFAMAEETPVLPGNSEHVVHACTIHVTLFQHLSLRIEKL